MDLRSTALLLLPLLFSITAQAQVKVKAKESALSITVPSSWHVQDEMKGILFLVADRNPGARIMLTAVEQTTEDFEGDDHDEFTEVKLEAYKEMEGFNYREASEVKKGKIDATDAQFITFTGDVLEGKTRVTSRCTIVTFKRGDIFYFLFGIVPAQHPKSFDSELVKLIQTIKFEE